MEVTPRRRSSHARDYVANRETCTACQAVFQNPQPPNDQPCADRCDATGTTAGRLTRCGACACCVAAAGVDVAAEFTSSQAIAKPAARAARRSRSLLIVFAHFRPGSQKPASPNRMMQKWPMSIPKMVNFGIDHNFNRDLGLHRDAACLLPHCTVEPTAADALLIGYAQQEDRRVLLERGGLF